MSQFVKIEGRCIGKGYAPYIVAEMSGNHNCEIERAFRIIDAAKASGADAVKIQTYKPETITIDHDGDEFLIKTGLWQGKRLYQLYQEAHTPWEWHAQIFEHAKKVGITLFSSPFDHTAVDFLEDLGSPAYKVASPELIDLPLIKKIAQTGKPIIMSTGASTLAEIGEAINVVKDAGVNDLIILHCTAAYPAPIEEANLATIADLADRFNVVVGLSDHTIGTTVSSLAIGLGASFIEKHFTLSRDDGGVDSSFSIDPYQLADLVKNARIASQAVGVPTYGPTMSESSVVDNRRSLYVVKPIAKGEVFTADNIKSIRPAKGIKPKYWEQVIGLRANRDLKFGESLQFDVIEGWETTAGER